VVGLHCTERRRFNTRSDTDGDSVDVDVVAVGQPSPDIMCLQPDLSDCCYVMGLFTRHIAFGSTVSNNANTTIATLVRIS